MTNKSATYEKGSHEVERIRRHWQEAVPNDRMAHLVRDLARSFHRSLEWRLAEHEVPLGHWTYLRILWERDGLTQRELSFEAGVMEPSTVTALKAMEARGYIERRHLHGNRKSLHVFLTPRGKALREVLVPLAEEVNAIALEGMSDRKVSAARDCLLQMLENLIAEQTARSSG